MAAPYSMDLRQRVIEAVEGGLSCNQAAARLIEAHPDGTISLSAEAAVVLADHDHPAFGMGMFHRLPQTMNALEHVRESFQTGVGHDYDSHGPEGAVGIERSFEPWNKAFLLPVVLPALGDMVQRLQAAGFRADLVDATDQLGKRIRAAKLEKIPYVLVVGDDDVAAATVGVNPRGGEVERGVTVDGFVSRLADEVSAQMAVR